MWILQERNAGGLYSVSERAADNRLVSPENAGGKEYDMSEIRNLRVTWKRFDGKRYYKDDQGRSYADAGEPWINDMCQQCSDLMVSKVKLAIKIALPFLLIMFLGNVVIIGMMKVSQIIRGFFCEMGLGGLYDKLAQFIISYWPVLLAVLLVWRFIAKKRRKKTLKKTRGS